MIAAWMLSAVLFTAFAGAAAFCAERALRAVGRQARWPWLIALAAGVTWPVLAPVIRHFLPATSTIIVMSSSVPAIQVVPDVAASIAWTRVLDAVLLAMWVVASAVALGRLIRAVIAIARVRRASRPQVVDGVTVLVSDTAGPAVVGVLRPNVLFPSTLLELDAPLRQLVLRHEQEHCRARDPWLLMGSAFALALVPWNLPLWWIARRMRLALEVDCDARVLAVEPDTTRYGQLLMLISQRERPTLLVPTLAASRSHLERRIAAMRPINTPSRRTKIAVSVAAAAIAGIAACTSRIADVAGPRPTIAARPADADSTKPYFEFQVNNAARPVPGTGDIQYPDMLRAANVSGDVLVQFVVDENGAVMPASTKVLKSDHELFTQAVKTALATMRFYPAEVQGRHVKQLVQWPFVFTASNSSASVGIVSRTATVRPGTPIRPEPPRNANQPYFEFQVEKQASQVPGTGNLRYPDSLRTAKVSGEVLVQFVVDANGAYEPGSLKVLKSSHDLFTRAVALGLPNMRFYPAQVGGKAVRQLIQQPFTFAVSR
ncbi:MAG: M56 family metallopeptidase [bacterium]